MRDVLTYTHEDLCKLSKNELKALTNECLKMETELDVGQMTLKIMMNSLYGAMANKYFPLFNAEIAKAITGNGRYFIRGLGGHLDKKLKSLIPSSDDYIIYSDTDSVYFTIENLVDKFIDKNPNATISEIVDFCGEIEKKIIDKSVDEFIESYSNELNAFDSSMIGAKREVISDRAVFVAKKKYLMQVRDNEGVRYSDEHPYMKVQGLEVIKGGTPSFTKKNLMEMIPLILNSSESEVKSHLKNLKQEFINQPINDICIGQGVSRVDYDLNENAVPNGSRAAIVFNEYIKNNSLVDFYSLISGGATINKLFLKTPNKFNSDVIGFEDESFIKEIDKSEIDFDKMFDKGFVSMLKLMTDALNWDVEKDTQELDDW